VFALEVVVVSRLQWSAWLPVLVASFAGHYACLGWGIHHTDYQSLMGAKVEISLLSLGKFALVGLIAGLVAQGYARLTHGIQVVGTKLFKWPPWRPFAGGCLVIALVYLLETRDFLGLGVTNPAPDGASILASFHENGMSPWAWFWKLLFTAITIGSGFKGGEVTPLFFIGAALGHTTGLTLQAPVPLFAALGFVAVFAGAAKTPLACAVMAGELFGWHLLVPAAIACEIAFLASGRPGIYSSQRHYRHSNVIPVK
jgi:H+/Cl- antiporter ClcA